MASVNAQSLATVPLAATPHDASQGSLPSSATGGAAGGMGNGGSGVDAALPSGADGCSHSQADTPQKRQQRPLRQTTLQHGAAQDDKASVHAGRADAATSTAAGAAAGVAGDYSAAPDSQPSDVAQGSLPQPTHPALDEERAELTANRR